MPHDFPAAKLRARLLDAALELAPTLGWNSATVRAAAKAAGLTPGEAELAAPRGAPDLIDALADRADEAMCARLSRADLGALKVRQRVALGIRARLEALAPDRAAERRAIAHTVLAGDLAGAARRNWRTADRLWRALGDPSTDENYYSKRALLAGVLAATLTFWLADESEDNHRTWAFLDARIGDVMRLEGVKARLKPIGLYGAGLAGALAKLRYG